MPSSQSDAQIAQAIARRGTLPIAIVAAFDDITKYKNRPWELVYDHAELRWRKHRHGGSQAWVARHIRCDEPANMVEGLSVPIDERDRSNGANGVRERRNYVAEIAERIIREGAPGVRLDVDFDLEREVLDELWQRWREVTADGFLIRALKARA